MSKIQYGRREGQIKSAPAPINTLNPFPHGTSLRDVTILQKNDWERIQYQLNRSKIEQDELQKKKDEAENLYQQSIAKHSEWKNTIEGQWKSKLTARQHKIEKEEAEKKHIDMEHQQYIAGLRKEAIEKAKTKQYFQTDRVKGFHSALILAEVLKERDAQVELNRLKEEATKGIDDEWLKNAHHEYEEAILRDQREAMKKIEQRTTVAHFQKAQINQHLMNEEKKKEEDMVEAKELKKLAAQFALEKKRLAEIQELESKQMMADNVRQIEDVKKMKAVRKMQEDEEDEECRVFAAAKKKMMKMRKDREKELHFEKLRILDEIRETLGAQLKHKVDDEDTRIQNAVVEADRKRQEEEEKKQRKIQKSYKEIALHRVAQIEYNEKQAKERKRAEIAAMMAQKEADSIFVANELEKMRRRHAEDKEVADFLSKQAEARVEKRKIVQQQTLEEEKKNKELLDIEEKQFQEYAQKVISHAEVRGRNTYPLKKAALEGAGGGLGPQFMGKGGIRPSYMVADMSGVQLPSFQNDVTRDMKQTVAGKDTNKRLGFVW